MDKKKYYVAVDTGPHAGQIHEKFNPDDPYYDYEIEATSEEIEHLADLFREIEEADFRTYLESHIPYETQQHAQASRVEDQQLDAVYKLIYKLGTPQTKQAMEQAGLPH